MIFLRFFASYDFDTFDGVMSLEIILKLTMIVEICRRLLALSLYVVSKR